MTFITQQTYLTLPESMYTLCSPSAFPHAHIALKNDALFNQLDQANAALSDEEWMNVLLNDPDKKSLSLAYAGHQFGHYSPLLGDGRAHLVGQMTSLAGDRCDIQLKGSGRTRYSRNGDGLATLSAIVREHVIGEALTGLGIPATRTLMIIETGENVLRDYQYQKGAIQVRTARSHIRVGSFEYIYHREGVEGVKALADYMIQHHLASSLASTHPYLAFFEQVVHRQAKLISQWMLVGFIHGVMNTDNMSLLESIDFGPCAFLDGFEFMKTFSAIDQNGRYAWVQQGQIGYWNLQRLAETLLPLFSDNEQTAVEMANGILMDYARTFQHALHLGFCQKFCLNPESANDKERQDKDAFIHNSLAMLEKQHIDFTCFFDALTLIAEGNNEKVGLISLMDETDSGNWLLEWEGVRSDEAEHIKAMRSANPRIIARNHQVKKAIDAAEEGDFSLVMQLSEALKNPYVVSDKNKDFLLAPTPEECVLRTFCGT